MTETVFPVPQLWRRRLFDLLFNSPPQPAWWGFLILAQPKLTDAAGFRLRSLLLGLALGSVQPLKYLLPVQAERLPHPQNYDLFEIVLSRDDNRAIQPRFGHDVVVTTLTVELATLAFTNLDEFFPFNRAPEQRPLAASRQCKRGWFPQYSQSLCGGRGKTISAPSS